MLSLYKVFTSHAVIQRERPIVFSGYGVDANALVKASFAGHTSTAFAYPDGTWKVTFPAMAAGGPYELSVSCGSESLILTDILVGEVWLCSGQSNMQMPLNSPRPFWRTANADAECANANYPKLRIFDYTNQRCLQNPGESHATPEECAWRVCTPESIYSFSAAAYFFGRKLVRDLDIPVGLISCAVGGTIIQAWTPRHVFARHHWQEINDFDWESNPYHYLNDDVVSIAERDKSWKYLGAPLAKWVEKFNALGEVPSAWLQENADTADWHQCDDCTQPIALETPGRYVVRCQFYVSGVDTSKSYHLSGLKVNDCDRTYLNGVEIGHTDTDVIYYWDCVRNYTIPAGLLHDGANTLVVVADNHCCTGEVRLEQLALCADDATPCALQIRNAVMRQLFESPSDFPPRPATQDTPNNPGALYNYFYYAWRRYAIRGVIWYQGCDNSGCRSYYQLMKMWIEGLRELWNDNDMPILIGQLASYHAQRAEQPYSEAELDAIEADPNTYSTTFAITREVQAAIRDTIPNVGMACIYDIGEAADIHPRNKQDFGGRLALLAERNVYHCDIEAEGPQFDGCRREGNNVRILYKHARGLHTTDGKAPRGFTCMNRAGELFKADATIDDETIVVSCKQCPVPEAVRYAFTSYCRVNLVNDAALPAEPFRTDAINYAKSFR